MSLLLLLVVDSEAWWFSWLKWGRCPYMGTEYVVPNKFFNGTWFVRSGYNIDYIQGSGRCISLKTLSYDKAAEVANVRYRHWSSWNNDWVSTNTTIKEEQGYGKYTLQLHERWGFLDKTLPFWILRNEDKNYSIAYSCQNFLYLFHHYSSWVLSRSSYSDMSFIDDILQEAELDPTVFVSVNQTRCF